MGRLQFLIELFRFWGGGARPTKPKGRSMSVEIVDRSSILRTVQIAQVVPRACSPYLTKSSNQPQGSRTARGYHVGRMHSRRQSCLERDGFDGATAVP